MRANQGDARAQYYLGKCYYFGDGVPEDKKKAFRLFSLAAEQGLAKAQRLEERHIFREEIEKEKIERAYQRDLRREAHAHAHAHAQLQRVNVNLTPQQQAEAQTQAPAARRELMGLPGHFISRNNLSNNLDLSIPPISNNMRHLDLTRAPRSFREYLGLTNPDHPLIPQQIIPYHSYNPNNNNNPDSSNNNNPNSSNNNNPNDPYNNNPNSPNNYNPNNP